MSDEPIHILIADDHSVVRAGMRFLLATEPGIDIVGEAEDGEQVVQKARELHPDVILMDLKMPHKDGVAAITEIKRLQPDTRILVLTSFSDNEHVFAAIKAGAHGYLLKDSSPQELIEAIRDVHAGESSLHPVIARKLIQELNAPPTELPPTDALLTERELEVIMLVARGLSNRDIGIQLVVSERTIRSHVSSILAKLHLANRTQAALYAIRKGLGGPSSAT